MLGLVLLVGINCKAQVNVISGSGPGIAGLYARLPQLGSNNTYSGTNSFTAIQFLTNPTNGNILVMDANGNMVSVAPNSIFSGFSGDATQLATTGGITSVKSGAIVTNLNVVSNIVIGAGTNAASLNTTLTNWTSGLTNQNLTGRTIFVSTPCSMTPALLAGNANFALVVQGLYTNPCSAPSLLALLVSPTVGFVSGNVPNGSKFWFTNLSTAGSSAIANGGYYETH